MKKSIQLDRYRQFGNENIFEEIYFRASLLDGIHIAHINTTRNGGGVAELLHSFIPIMQELGIKHSWEVVELTDLSKNFMFKLWDMLQGESGVFPQAEGEAHVAELSRYLKSKKKIQADVYIVHDFILAPLAHLSPYMRPAIWFCHIDTANPVSESEMYIRQFLNAYDLCAFNTQASILKELPRERVQVISLGINPFSTKNRPLPTSERIKLLTRCGIDVARPLISQISRFGKWKNPWQVIDAYRLVKRQVPSVQLALVGAMQAAEDIRASTILAELENYAEGDSDIHLLSDPNLIGQKEVNAFQSHSTVIFQRSRREGFGLTVTEAMWKKQAVVGTSATGLRQQIVHGHNGYIADETEMCAEYAVQLIHNSDLSHQLGEQAHAYVRSNFLLPMMLLDFLKALSKVV